MKKYIITTCFISVLFVSHGAYAEDMQQEERAEARAQRRAEIEAERVAAMEERAIEKQEKMIAKVCERVDAAIARVETQTQNFEQRYHDRLEKRRAKVDENRAVRNEGLYNRRAQRDMQREEFYAKMRERAQNDEQIAAIEEFKNVIEDAVDVRRSAIDVAREEFYAGVDALVNERVAYVNDLYEDYQSQEADLVVRFEEFCSDDGTEEDLNNIIQDFNSELKALRAEFRASAKEQRNISDEIAALRESRKATVNTAIEEFTTTVDAAREELKAAVGVNDDE